MSAWHKDEHEKIAKSDDLHVAPFREDGKTYGTPTWIWSVKVDGDLYVRGYNGQTSRWYQAALHQRSGLDGLRPPASQKKLHLNRFKAQSTMPLTRHIDRNMREAHICSRCSVPARVPLP